MSKQKEAQSMELVVVQTAITRMDKLSEGLKDLTQRFGGVVFDVKSPKGMTEAKAARREVAAPRIEVEKVRKEAKAPILELGRKLDAEAARITKELAKIEDPIALQISTEEQRVENERLERVRREEQRVADIQGRIHDMRQAVNGALRARTSAEVVRILADVQKVDLDAELFAEFLDAAALAKRESVSEIERIRDDLISRETEAERLRKDREDFERKRAAQEAIDKAARDAEDERQRKERAKFEAEQAAERSRVAAENARVAAEQAAAQKVIDDQRRELEARQQAERDAQAQREREARVAEERRAALEQSQREEAERQAEAQRIANYRPSFDEIVTLLAANYRVEPAKVRTWITEAKAGRKAA